MKKILSYILILVLLSISIAEENKNFELIEESEEYYIINFSIDDFELESVEEYTKILTKTKGSTTELGMPKLPQFSALIEIDGDYTYNVEYNILSSQKIKDIKIFPNQAMVNGLEKSSIEDVNESYYSSSQLYPENKVSSLI